MPLDPQENEAAILKSPSYRLAQEDIELLARPELRPVRMQLELLKPELLLETQNVQSTIVVYGSTQIVEQQHAADRLERAQAAAAADPTQCIVSSRGAAERTSAGKIQLLRRGPRIFANRFDDLPNRRPMRLRDRHRRRTGDHGGGEPRRFDVGANRSV